VSCSAGAPLSAACTKADSRSSKPIDDNQLLNKISTYFRLIEKERELNRVLEEKVAERTLELRQAKQHLENIIEYMGEALLLLNREGIVRKANPAACAMLGYGESELQGMSIGDVFEEGVKYLKSKAGADA